MFFDVLFWKLVPIPYCRIASRSVGFSRPLVLVIGVLIMMQAVIDVSIAWAAAVRL